MLYGATSVIEHIGEAEWRWMPSLYSVRLIPDVKWIDNLPDQLQDVHGKFTTRRMAAARCFATSKSGRRLYVNRTAVDADQLVVPAAGITTRSWLRSEGAIFRR